MNYWLHFQLNFSESGMMHSSCESSLSLMPKDLVAEEFPSSLTWWFDSTYFVGSTFSADVLTLCFGLSVEAMALLWDFEARTCPCSIYLRFSSRPSVFISILLSTVSENLFSLSFCCLLWLWGWVNISSKLSFPVFHYFVPYLKLKLRDKRIIKANFKKKWCQFFNILPHC